MPNTITAQLSTEDVHDLVDHLHTDLCHRYDATARAYDTPPLDDGRKHLIFEHTCRFILWNRRRIGILQQQFYTAVDGGNFPSELAAMLFDQPSEIPAAFSHGIDVAELRHLHSMYLSTVGHLKQQAVLGRS